MEKMDLDNFVEVPKNKYETLKRDYKNLESELKQTKNESDYLIKELQEHIAFYQKHLDLMKEQIAELEKYLKRLESGGKKTRFCIKKIISYATNEQEEKSEIVHGGFYTKIEATKYLMEHFPENEYTGSWAQIIVAEMSK